LRRNFSDLRKSQNPELINGFTAHLTVEMSRGKLLNIEGVIENSPICVFRSKSAGVTEQSSPLSRTKSATLSEQIGHPR
jgi:hypothetical protein